MTSKNVNNSIHERRELIISVSTFAGNIPGFFGYFINSMYVLFDRIIVVSKEHINSLSDYDSSNKIVYYELKCGDDFDRWIYALDNTEIDIDNTLVFFSNDTIYGPVCKNAEFVELLQERDSECIGLTNQIFQLQDGKKINYIHTYYFALRAKALDFFKNSFLKDNNIEMPREVYLSYFLNEMGVGVDCLIDSSDENGLPGPDILSTPLTLSCKYNIPFIPRYVFTMPTGELQLFSDGFERFNLQSYFKTSCDYPLKYIIEDGLNQLNIYDFINRYGMAYVVDEHSKNIVSSKCAVIIYLFYEDQFSEYYKWISVVPKNIDIIFLTPSRYIIDSLKQHLNTRKNIKYICVNSRGRDWGALLSCLNDMIDQYDIACFMHDKSFHSFEFPSQAVSFRNLLWNNLLPSFRGVLNIIYHMENNPYIGLMVPPVVKMGSYFKYFGNFWTVNFDNTKRLLSDLGVSSELLCEEKPPVSIGGMFWFRPKALAVLFRTFDVNSFPEEPLDLDGTVNHALERAIPYIAQANGFATSYVITSEYICHDWLLSNEMMQSLNGYKQFSGNTYYDQLGQ